MAENMPGRKHHRPLKAAVALVAVVAAMIVAVSAAAPQTLNDMVSYIVYSVTGDPLPVETGHVSIDAEDMEAVGTCKYSVVDGEGVIITEDGEAFSGTVHIQEAPEA